MGAGRNWTKEEENYLAENWGHSPVPNICTALNRSKNAIMVRVQRMGLPAFLESGEYITLNQLMIAVNGNNSGHSYKMKSWVENRRLPVHNKRNNRCTFRVVYLDEFWKWAENNRSFIDFSKMEPLILGEEPDWVSAQRKKDFCAFANQRKDPWTPQEDSRLIMLLKQYRYGYAELSEMLHRSAGAIQRRCVSLGLRERPVKADNHQEWTDNDFNILAEGIKAGESYSQIGKMIGRSEKAVRGKVYAVYLTENADKVRAMIGNGDWGSGAPAPTVKQAISLSGHRSTIKKEIANLAGIIAYRRNQLGYEPYWQRHMCIKWHDVKGCTAGCTDCDSCADFERIKPQYCVRCGCMFYEREKNNLCNKCRIARKKQHLRKWHRLHMAGVSHIHLGGGQNAG